MNSRSPSLLWALVLILVSGTSLYGQLNRGVWFWGSTTTPDGPSPYGSSVVVGDAAKEDETITFFTTHGVKRVYGSYQNRPVSEAGVIAAWNEKLEFAGIQSQLLFDLINIHDPAEVASLLNKIQTRFINFNSSFYDLPQYRFDAIHLDIEPQGSAPWDAADGMGKRAILDDLSALYADIRALLVTEGMATVPIYADIPYTWDKLPADGGSIAWADASDRDAWFAGLGASLNGLSIMTFSKDTVPELTDATDYERTGAFPGFARIAIQPKGWPGEQWESIWEVNGILNDLEALHAPNHATDLENYAFWRYSIENSLLVAEIVDVDIVIWEDDPGIPFGEIWTGPSLYLKGRPNTIYTIKRASSLDGKWEELAQLKTRSGQESETLRYAITLSEPRAFYQVTATPANSAQ
ncbi:hypothetical protein [Roseibacillus ishigakijimensis]|uniref:Uncharacterized protein n=1 Tax=Roseibacillus ishigakijimensis TaxID=454146 RepID=A0A934RN27_9BACT|nr:hypothetical protein [Roseibacillus ishigakijimensis]MBK1834419.1 hypothetical protein [Roseibacillus ishigakijimensis]